MQVQQTMHEMGTAVLMACPRIHRVHLRLPNKHRLLVDLKAFGLDNRNEIFVWTDEPYGDIQETLTRR